MLWIVDHPPAVDQEGRKKRIATLGKFRDDILRIARAYGATNVQIVPSTKPAGLSSEEPLELLVDMKPSTPLHELGKLQHELAMFLDIWIKVTTKDGLSAERPSDFLLLAVPL